MKVFDTSVFVSAFLRNDPSHEKAVHIVGNTEEKVLIPYAILSEVLTVLTYRHSKDLAQRFLEHILQENHFVILDGAVIEDIGFWWKFSSRISFPDITAILAAYKYNAELITFDKDQEKQWRKGVHEGK